MTSRSFLRPTLSIVATVLILVQASSCCCCLGGVVTPTMTPFPIDKDQAAAMRERAMAAKAEKGPFTLTITDQELTSYAVGLAQSGAGEFPAKDIKLKFNDGYLEAWATFVEIAPTDLPVYVRGTVEAANGQIVFSIAQANAGPFGVPGAMRELIAQSLGETLAELGLGLEVDQIAVRAGEMTLSGRVTGYIPDLPMYVAN